MALLTLAPVWGALPGREPAAATPAQLGSPVPLLWTPRAEIQIGTPGPLSALDGYLPGGDTFGPFYILKAPADGIVEYLYSWTGFFAVGEPLARFYDARLLPDLQQARALAGQFNAQPFIIAGLAARRLPAAASVPDFPAPTTTPASPSQVLPGPAADQPPAAPAPEASRARLERKEKAALPARAQLTPARAELAAAEKKLAETEQELAARKQLQTAGVLAPEEVTRFEAARQEAAAAVSSARRNVEQAEAAATPPPAPSAIPPLRAVAPMPLPAVPALPGELQRLTVPRWDDLLAPTGGLVVKPMVPPGSSVKQGAPILKVTNSAWARVRVMVSAELAFRFDRSVPVTVSFPEVPGLRFAGWVTGKRYIPGDDRVVVEMLVTRPDDPYETQSVLLAMAYASPQAQDARELELAPKPAHSAGGGASDRLFGLVPAMMVVGKAQDDAADQSGPLSGRVALVPPVPRFGPAPCPDPKLQDNLKQLHDWQNSFVAGMTTAIYNQKLLLSYPREGEISRAVEKMMKGEVEHDPGYCARTLRLALGWGLGDAYNWATQLPQRGWQARADGLPRPGDILVWPFTYGRNHSQHIGVAVRQGERMMLLSNLEGRLGTSEILGGYIAFYKPTAPALPVPGPPPHGR
jgi:biotin carboxyl carrier protein